ncbi:LPXTG cell wall anchor domain-containing protein [Longispora sp. K20-0274]|uniref:LPXTG cell wall anchor domain-containing protein n=1 Tax=Longispora sp. K20-0274 TaxID=3088255 RepID=UPI00399A5DF0
MTAVTAALASVSAPAWAASVPNLSIVSLGEAVVSYSQQSSALELTMGPVTLRNTGAGAATKAVVRFELDARVSSAYQFAADADLNDPRCKHPAVPTGLGSEFYLDCEYPVAIAAGGTASLTASHLLALRGGAGDALPTVKVTVTSSGEDSDTKSVVPTWKKLTADLAVTVDASRLHGNVGDVVDLPWTVTNLGPDVATDGFALILIAPPGTEWTGAAAATCNPPRVPNTEYRCASHSKVEVGAAHSVTETWQLKIVSSTIGSGTVQVAISGNPAEYRRVSDLNPANDIARIDPVRPGATPTSGAAPLPVTGSSTTALVAGGAAAVLLGVVLTLLIRRRRVTFTAAE